LVSYNIDIFVNNFEKVSVSVSEELM
jgi:hypothetical protein